MRRIAPLLALVLAFLIFLPVAQAATAQTKVRLFVRERPSSSSRVVERLGSHKRVTVLGRSGSWSHIDTGRRDGWVPTHQLAIRGGSANESRAKGALAPHRHVRPEAWVSHSEYHDGENVRLTVKSDKAELYGRPAMGGAVLGILRRGDEVHLVKRSEDRRWYMVDIGGGEVAWVDARKLSRGGVARPPIPDADGVQADDNSEEAPVSNDDQASARNDAPAPRRERFHTAAAAPPSDSSDSATTRDDDEVPPGLASDKQPRVAQLDSRDDQPATAPERASAGAIARTAPATASGDNVFGLGVRTGIAVMTQSFRSNGTGLLTNYNAASNGLALALGANYLHAFGAHWRVGVDLGYAYAGLAALNYAGTSERLAIQSHFIGLAADAALHFDVLGGLLLRARLGGEAQLNLIQASTKSRLPSDRVLGMDIGLGVDLPALFVLANRPLGVSLYGGLLAPAQRAQTAGLEDGASSSTIGGGLNAFVSYALLTHPTHGQFSVLAGYTFETAVTHYQGQSRRNSTITSAARSSSDHLLTVGVAWNY